MADTTKDIDYLRYYFTSEEALKDKDILKSQAFDKYEKNVGLFVAIPMVLQVAQIT